VLAGVVGYYLLANQAAWLRWLPVVGGIILAAVVIAWSQYGTDLRQFMHDARVELRKIVWPSRQETGMTTMVVFVFVLAAGLFFWGLDLVLAWATRALTGQGG
jgi:preprotein translocase subunit SecE